MNYPVMIINKIKQAFLIAFIGLSVMSCGSGSISTSGISGTGIVFGSITGFGSIFVNGVEYEIDDASFNVDGNTLASQANLGLGMVVTLNASNNGDGTGVATSVVYDDTIEGPIATVPQIPTSGPDSANSDIKQFLILGQTVFIDVTSTTFENISFNTIAMGDVVEISGFANFTNNTIIATRVEKKGNLSDGDDEVEMHGVIENLVPDVSFNMNGITIDISNIMPDDLEDLEDGLSEGLLVEVKGIFQNATTVLAEEIEGEDDDRQEIENGSSELSLQGVINIFNSPNSFEVNGISIDASSISSAITDLLEVGAQVEVEGLMESNILIAEELEIRSGEAHYKALVKSVDVANNSLGIGFPGVTGEIIITVNSQSQLEDELEDSDSLLLSQLSAGMEIKTEVKRSGSNWIVTSLKRSTLEEFKVEGIVSAKSGIDNLSINGLILSMDSEAEYEIDDDSVSATAFFNAITPATTKVELVDVDKDGLFDKAEIED